MYKAMLKIDARRGGLALTLSCAALLAACSSLNPFSKDEPRNKPNELVPFTATLAVRPAWNLSLSGGAPVGFAPIAAQGSVFAATADGTVVRVEAATGRVLWRVSAAKSLSAGAGSDGGTVAVGTSEGAVIALDGDGKEKWRARASSEILAPPVVSQGLVIVRSGDNRIHAFDADTGKRRWTYQRQSPALTLRSPSGIAVAPGAVFAGFAGGKLAALAIGNGALRWEGTVANPRGATELERVADVVGRPVLTGGAVCAVTFQGRVACFDAASGNPLWAREASSTSGLDADARFVFVSDEKSILLAFARDNGSNLWKQEQLLYRNLSAPASSGRAVVVADGKGYVHWLAREDGGFLARSATDGTAIVAPPLTLDRTVIVQTSAGGLYAFGTD